MSIRKKSTIKFIIASIIVVALIILRVFSLGLSFDLIGKTDLNLENLNATYEIHDDGSMTVTELWDMNIGDEKNYRVLFETISFKDSNGRKISSFEDYELISIREPENNIDYFYEDAKEDDQRSPYSYTVVRTNSSISFEWAGSFYEERRLFEVKYRVKNVVNIYNDTAEFYWKFVSDKNSMDISSLNIKIIIPDSLKNNEEIKFWGHAKPIENARGTNVQRENIDGKDTVVYTAQNVLNSTFIEARVTLPTSGFTSGNYIEKDALDGILDEEMEWSNKTDKAVDFAKKVVVADIIVAILLVLIAVIYFLRRFKSCKRYASEFTGEYYHQPPADLHPTFVSRLYSYYGKSTSGDSDLSVCLLQMAYKGHIRIDTIPAKNNAVLITQTSQNVREELAETEKQLYSIISRACAQNGGSATMSQINKYVGDHQESSKSKIDMITNLANGSFKSSGCVDDGANSKANATTMLGICMIVAFIMANLVLINRYGVCFTAIATALFAIASLVYARSLKRLTQEGENEHSKWVAFGKYMQDFSLLSEREAPELVVWEKYLIYATAMGIADKVSEQLKMIYPELSDPNFSHPASTFRTYGYIHLLSSGSGINSIGSIGKGMQAMRVASIPSSDSGGFSGGGGGGGFSGGGGGGGGGASMGGR